VLPLSFLSCTHWVQVILAVHDENGGEGSSSAQDAVAGRAWRFERPLRAASLRVGR